MNEPIHTWETQLIANGETQLIEQLTDIQIKAVTELIKTFAKSNEEGAF